MNSSVIFCLSLRASDLLESALIDLQRFATKSKLAGPWQRARLRNLGRIVPWNLSRTRATQFLRELQPSGLVDHILAPFQQRQKFQRNEHEVRKRIDRLVSRSRERGVPPGVIVYEGRKYADALTAIPRSFERNLAMEEAIERSGLTAGKYYMRGLMNSP